MTKKSTFRQNFTAAAAAFALSLVLIGTTVSMPRHTANGSTETYVGAIA